jgi:hypothetical protein
MRYEDLNPPAMVKIAMNLEEELAQKINEREEKIVTATLEHARIQGEDLRRLKQHLGKRKFAPWVKAHCRISRTTAYKYMKVADQWDAICKPGEQITSLRQVLRLLLGKRKAKHQSGPAPTPEDDPPTPEGANPCLNNEEPSSVSAPGETIQAGLEADGAVVAEPEEDERKPESEAQKERNHDSEDRARTKNDNKPARKPRRKGRQRHRRAQQEGATGKPSNALVIPIKHLHLKDYFLGLINELLEYHRKGIFMCGGIFPESVRAIMEEEDISVQLFLAVIQRQIDVKKTVEELRKESMSDKTKTQQKCTPTKKAKKGSAFREP